MTIKYLKGYPWNQWTRDERYFCSILYSKAVQDVPAFASWLINAAKLPLSKRGSWDLGYEVCFYRDYLWQIGKKAMAEGFSPKRTFDLCLFGETQLIVIEAKVFEPFKTQQNEEIERDKERLRLLPGLKHLQMAVVALASSRYFHNARIYGRSATLSVFDGTVSWAQAAEKYQHPSLFRADLMYKMTAGAYLEK